MTRFILGMVMAIALGWFHPLVATSSTGEGGIQAERLHNSPYNLLGRKIAIGQVEIGRPGQFGIDKGVPPEEELAPDLAGIFLRDRAAVPGSNVDGHAHGVASVMVSSHKQRLGVAPQARLYSSASSPDRGGNRQGQHCLSAQQVAEQNSDDVRAINFSFGEPLWLDPRPDAVLDGNALLTLCIDWSANHHNTLYVIAGNQGQGGIPIPTDHYNGINVASSHAHNGRYDQVDVSNLGNVFEPPFDRLVGLETNVDGRLLISLLAPGRDVKLLSQQGEVFPSTGTSFASPHVVGTVALLQEYGDRQLRENAPHWSLDARQNQVMKAVILNSADKVADSGDGLRQGMTRTIGDRQGGNWLTSEAHRNPKVPVHRDMGTGHLNAHRAYQQFSPGQWSASEPVPAMGWDFNQIASTQVKDYVLDAPLKAESYVAATLTWNRQVDLNDSNGDGRYDINESFRDRGLNDLNLYLMPADSDNIDEAIAASTSEVDSLEHLFQAVPRNGRYKLRVVYQRQVNDPAQDYAIAWWTVPDA
ncbi:S8 family serine peptidase [Phormidium yuhuli AB48]|uniref:S8 family serine peptidase n=1 Tax=Phormidium yuhuli AB48 TaxID=2940671 RepID=A0ABY5APF6_9CYAN|nr:S8 family serine peptidase [Phormidium yuhuli]USR91095.1 S8 family serine peptidase [Phormidium yuhuli AB48]